MVDLASTYQSLMARWDRARENRRLIDREKRMIDPTSIVLYGDFHNQVVQPALSSHQSFTRHFESGAEIGRNVSVLAQTGIHLFPVRLKDVEGKIKDDALADLNASIDGVEKMAMMFAEALATGFGGSDEGGNIRIIGLDALGEKSRQQTIDYFLETQYVPGMYVKDIVLAMNMHRPTTFGTRVGRYELEALARDEGQHVVDFWKAVRNLRDYSGLFPDKPPPRGNSHDDKGGRAPIGGMVAQGSKFAHG